ncbi:uncharacterized protein LOC105847457 [Hydra vulgaris]|uniref:uncharacterized protein LOC105847457 n=2 Tax=Hydra vulgaris TaxID=6087 RepID=UPI001F5E7FC8|nr:uncharacterized protein LOC105847457 [Hydra vulgaris]
MAFSEELFTGETLDYIININADDELNPDLQEYFDNALLEVTDIGDFKCKICKSKTYKTKGGLARHNKNKHTIKSLTDMHYNDFVTDIKKIVAETKADLSTNKCYPQEVISEIKDFEIKITENFFDEIRKMSKKLKSSGNAEKYYSNFYSNIVLFSDTYFNLKKPASTVFTTKLCNKLFQHFQSSPSKNVEVEEISPREVDGLKYLSGYVIRNLLKKAKTTKNYKSQYNQAIIALLLQTTKEVSSSEKLINTQNRGGLTAVCEECYQIFLLAEKHFRQETAVANLRNIESKNLTKHLLKDPNIISFYNAIVHDVKFVSIDKEIKLNLLEKMIELYFRVRTFSLAKNITAKNNDQSFKVKSLRKSIKRKSNNK